MGDVNTMVTHIAKGNLVDAQKEFEDMMNDRVSARLEQEKVAVASNVFDPQEDADVDDISDILDDLEDENEEDTEDEDV